MVYDYIIIGSGFGGSVSALRLAEKGYSVLVLEQGKRFNPSDFPKSNWNLPKYLWIPALRFFGFQKLSFFKTASILSGTGVGGGSLVYANTLYMPPDEYFSNDSWKQFNNWKEVLQPYYNKASFMLGRTCYNKLNIEDCLLREVAAEMDASSTFEPVNVGVNLDGPEEAFDPYFAGMGPLRKKCIECGGCMVGCREGAKNTLDMNYLWFAQKFGAQIKPQTRAEKISVEEGLYTIETQLLTSFFPQKITYRSKGIIVAAGTLGTMKLLLKQKYKYKTLPNLSQVLGNEIRTNAESLCAVSGANEKLNNGLAITSVFSPDKFTHVEIVKYPDNSNAMKWFFGLSVKGAASPFLRTLKLAGKTFTHPLRFLKTLSDFKWSTNMVIFLVMQSVDNSMKMVWRRGLFGSKMAIDNRGQKRVPAYIAVGQDVMERYAKKCDGIAQNILLEVLFDRPTTAHILGGCPMGENSENGVVDKNLKVFGYDNFYITDGSVIQGNIGVNPSLSITSLAEYAMDKIPAGKHVVGNPISAKLKQLEEEWQRKK